MVVGKISPLQKIRMNKRSIKKMWINEEVLDVIKIRDEKYRTAQILNIQVVWHKYNILRNQVIKNIRTAKEIYLRATIDDNKKQKNKKMKYYFRKDQAQTTEI